MSDDMLQNIVEHTNVKIQDLRSYVGASNRGKATYSDFNITELKCLIGCLIMAGTRKDNHLSAEHMFSSIYGCTFYKSLFSEKRFSFLLRCLRFDDQPTRQVRMQTDKFAHIRALWDCVMNNCKNNYKAGQTVTIDEQLLAFRGRCAFRMYIPNKPAKYGIKLFMVCDAEKLYCLYAIPYLGKESTARVTLNKGQYFSMKLLNDGNLIEAGRISCADNWFLSLNLATAMLREEMHLVGTIRPKAYMPMETVKNMRMGVKEAVAYFHHEKKVNMVSKKTKKKHVTFLTTIHNKFTYVENMKTEVNMFYNAAKGGVDAFDMMCAATSTNRKTERWPQCVFYGLLNIIMNNSWVIYKSRPENKRAEKYDFLLNMAVQLAKPWAEFRYTERHDLLPIPIREPLRVTFDLAPFRPAPPAGYTFESRRTADKRKRCKYGVQSTTWRGKGICNKCNGFVCNNHSTVLCKDCWHGLF